MTLYPTISVPGLRLKETFEKNLVQKGIRLLKQHVISDVSFNSNRGFTLDIDEQYKVVAKGIILASGRFISKGLLSDSHQIKESIFNTPVYQPCLP